MTLSKPQSPSCSSRSHFLRGVVGAALATLALCAPSAVQARVVEKIAALVGDDIILQSEVEEAARPYLAEIAEIADPAQRQARATALRKQALEALIDDNLVRQQADEMKIDVTSEEVDRAIEQVKKERGYDDATLARELKNYGMTVAAHRQMLKAQLKKEKVMNIIAHSRVTVSDADVQNFYDKHFAKGDDNVEVSAAHIFVAIPPGADDAAARERETAAKKILARAQAGEDFGKLARELSDDTATRKDGGKLGSITRDMGLPRSVEELIFRLRPGEIGGPVRGEGGFHVIKVLDRRSQAVKPLAEVKNQIKQQLWMKERERQAKIFLSELRRRSLVETRN